MSVNLAARLFPAIDLHADSDAVERAADLATAINPDIDLGPASGDQRTVAIRHGAAAHDSQSAATAIDVRADGWNVHVDDPGSLNAPAHPAAAMMAGVLGVSEAFRVVFADLLPRPRTAPTPMAWNILDLRAPHNRAPVDLPVQIGTVHLAGAGAIGQAAVATLAAWPGLTGTLVPVDPETVDLSNLQRYVLTTDVSVNQQKTDIVAAALSSTDIIVDPRPTHWNASHSAEARRVMVALDTARDRIAVQAGLPGAVYNAYTGAHDVGWSRHENFGTQACASCLYLPTGPAPSRTAEVADAIGEPEPRVALYYVTGVPVDKPLPAAAVGSLAATHPTWVNRSLLRDIAARHDLADEQVRAHEGADIDQFYGEAVCGGTLLPVPRGRAAVLPLPQASAVAGIMLAVQTVAACSPDLRQHLTHQPSGRLDLLGGATPYSSPLAPTPGCICQDPDYRAVYDARWVRNSR